MKVYPKKVKDIDNLKKQLAVAVNALKIAREQMSYWSIEIINCNVPAEFHSDRLKDPGLKMIDKALNQIEEISK